MWADYVRSSFSRLCGVQLYCFLGWDLSSHHSLRASVLVHSRAAVKKFSHFSPMTEEPPSEPS